MIRDAGSTIVIREMETIDELEDCVQLQQSVWQFRDLDAVPRRMFIVARAVGGQTFGALDGNRLVGFAMSIPGVRHGHSYLHSHMLAVIPEYRNLDIGMRLKFAQREDALARGIDLMEWTFDPLQTKNAYFNIEKLGAVVRRYTPDFYGASTSVLHGSLPTDRLHAEWWLRSRRVEALTAGRKPPEYTIKETVSVTYRSLSSNDKLLSPSDPTLEFLLQVRGQLLAAFKRGLAILRFQASSNQDARYLLGSFDERSEGGWF